MIGTEQIQVTLSQELRRARIGALTFVFCIFCIFVLIASSFKNPDFFSFGQIVVMIGLFCWWCWLFRHQPKKWMLIKKDLGSLDCEVIEGKAQLITHRGIGLFAPHYYRLLIKGYSFKLGYRMLTGFDPDKRYQVYFAKYSEIPVSIQEVEQSSAALEQDTVDLSEQEIALLALLVEGMPDKLIARKLNLEPATVRTYNSSLYKKLGVKGRKSLPERVRALNLPLSIDIN